MEVASAFPLEPRIWAALRGINDPEFPVSVVDLGLIYEVRADAGRVEIAMTFTAIGCGCAGWIVDDVRSAAAAVPGVEAVTVHVVWDPPWDRSRVSAEGAEQLARWGVTV